MKKIIAAASYYNQKYFFETEFDDMPIDIKKGIKIICVTLAEKLRCNFMVGFYKNGDLFFETQADEFDYNYDEIGAELEIQKLKREEKELIHSLQLWYVVFKTEEGCNLRENLINYNHRK